MSCVGPTTIALYELLDGKIFTDSDGIEMKIVHKSFQAIFPYQHTSHTLYAQPTEKGKATDAYWTIKQQLRDDWSTDLGESDDLMEIAEQVGVLAEYLAILGVPCY